MDAERQPKGGNDPLGLARMRSAYSYQKLLYDRRISTAGTRPDQMGEKFPEKPGAQWDQMASKQRYRGRQFVCVEDN